MSLSDFILRLQSRRVFATKLNFASGFPGDYSRGILLGAGVAATLTVLAVSAVGATLLLNNFFTERANLFEIQRDRIKTNIDRSQGRLKQTVESYELSWHLHKSEPLPDRRYLDLLKDNTGVTITGPEISVTPAMFFLLFDHTKKEKQVDEFLNLMREVSPVPLLRQRDVGHYLGGFVYSSNRQLFSITPPLSENHLETVKKNGVGSAINLSIEKVEEALSRASPDSVRKQRMVWVPFYTSPFTNELVGHYAAPVYCGEERIAVVVDTIPFDEFSALYQDSIHESGFFVIPRDREFTLGFDRKNPREYKLIQSILPYITDSDTVVQGPVFTRKGGTFFFSKIIPGPEWLAVYVFDWTTVLSALKVPLVTGSAFMFLVLAAVWGFIFFFDYTVLVPLRAHSRTVFESSDFNRAVLNIAPVALTVYDPSSQTVVMQNNASQHVLASSAEGVGLYSRLLKSKLLSSRSQENNFLFAEDGPIQIVETKVFDAGGKSKEISVAYSKTRYQKREVVLFGITDISEQKASVRLLRQARQAANRANKAKSMFLATISHEIRTPLHGALGNLELLALERLTQEQQGRVSTIRQAFDSLLALVNDVLDLSKMEAQEFKLNTELFCLEEVVERCARTFGPVILGKGLSFVCFVDPRLEGDWRGDARRLTQVIMNLLSNAQKFTEHGAITLRAMPGELKEGVQWVHISVSDSGIGIDVANLDNVFEPFVQADRTIEERFGGTGLGLTLCRRIMKLMGGDITVDSELGEGSLFRVNVPLKQEQVLHNPPGGQSLHNFNVVVVVCDTPLLQLTLSARIKHWFPDAKVIDASLMEVFSLDNERAVLVLAVLGKTRLESWRDVRPAYWDTLILSADGPLYPERQDRALCVTSLSASMFKLALCACGQQDWVLEPPVQLAICCAASRDSRVLIADDDPLSQKLLEHQLAALGYQHVHSASNGKQALDRCLINTYEVVITDLRMPVLDGSSLLKALRDRGITTPVIITTADCGAEIESSYGFEILHKPITMERLHVVLKQILGGGEAPQGDQGLPPMSVPADMRLLFLAGWDDELAALRAALGANDSQRFLGRLHRLKGALLALGERSIADACEALRLRIDSQGLIQTGAAINVLLEQLGLLVAAYRTAQDASP